MFFILFIFLIVLINGESETLWRVKTKLSDHIPFVVQEKISATEYIVVATESNIYHYRFKIKHAIPYNRTIEESADFNVVSIMKTKECSQYSPHQYVPNECVYSRSNRSEVVSFTTDINQITRDLFDISNVVNQPYDGTGKLGVIMDTGLDLKHCFFDTTTNFVDYYNPAATITMHPTSKIKIYFKVVDGVDMLDGHGSHVVGIHMGKSCVSNKGVNSGTSLIFFDIGNSAGGIYPPFNPYSYSIASDELVLAFGKAIDRGATYASSSWGASMRYDYYSEAYDYITYHNPYFVHIVSSGNYGLERNVYSPSNGKNVIAVGAYELGKNVMADFTSSNDATKRIAPLIALPGVGILSAKAIPSLNSFHTDMISKYGTSMAAPAVPIAALQQYLHLKYNAAPSAVLSRAVLFANTRPSRILDFKLNFWVLDNPNWKMYDFKRGNLRKCYDVGVGEVVVVLTWNDPPGENLIHDLDLKVSGVWGNHGSTSDVINTNEKVTLTISNNKTIQVIVNDPFISNEYYALVVYSQSFLTETDCNQTCLPADPNVECDLGNGMGYHLCGTNGKIDMNTCVPYSCDEGFMYSGNSTECEYVPPHFDQSCFIANGRGLRHENVSTCFVQSCNEQYFYTGVGCACIDDCELPQSGQNIQHSGGGKMKWGIHIILIILIIIVV